MDEARHMDVTGRRSRERRVSRWALLASFVLHFLILFFAPPARIPLDPAAATGPDDDALEGILQVVQMAQAAAPAAAPPPIPTVEVVLPEPVVPPPAPTPEIEPPPVELPDPGVGTSTGTDPDARADAAGSGGGGDQGGGGDGDARRTLPTPRGMIIPPTNRELRGSQVEIWVWVNAEGRVVADSTQLRPPTPDRRFNEQLVREAAQWVFNPAREGGVPVAAWFPYRIGME